MRLPFPQRVFLDKTDTCLTYALKRTGFAYLQITDSLDMLKYFDRKIMESNSAMEAGTIILWADNERYTQVPSEITLSGLVISHERLVGSHYGVYEGGNLVSDCTISSRDYNFCRSIRVRHLPEAMPTHYLQFK